VPPDHGNPTRLPRGIARKATPATVKVRNVQ